MNITFELSTKSSRECWDKPLQLLTSLLFNGMKTVSGAVGLPGPHRAPAILRGKRAAFYRRPAGVRACAAAYAQLCPTLRPRGLQSLESFRWEYWRGWPFPSPGDLPKPGMTPTSPASSASAGRVVTCAPLGKPIGSPQLVLTLQPSLWRVSPWREQGGLPETSLLSRACLSRVAGRFESCHSYLWLSDFYPPHYVCHDTYPLHWTHQLFRHGAFDGLHWESTLWKTSSLRPCLSRYYL